MALKVAPDLRTLTIAGTSKMDPEELQTGLSAFLDFRALVAFAGEDRQHGLINTDPLGSGSYYWKSWNGSRRSTTRRLTPFIQSLCSGYDLASA